MSWRPEGQLKWNKKTHGTVEKLGPLPPQTEFPIVVPNGFDWSMLRRQIFEAGADAILEALRGRGMKTPWRDEFIVEILQSRYGGEIRELAEYPIGEKHGTIVFIPDEETDALSSKEKI